MHRHQPHSKTTPTFRLSPRPPASFPDHPHLQAHSKTTPTFRLIPRPPASFPDHSHLPLLQYSENQRVVTLMHTVRAATEIVTRIRRMEVWLIVFLCILCKTHSVMWMVCGYLPQSQGHWQWSCVVTHSQAVLFWTVTLVTVLGTVHIVVTTRELQRDVWCISPRVVSRVRLYRY